MFRSFEGAGGKLEPNLHLNSIYELRLDDFGVASNFFVKASKANFQLQSLPKNLVTKRNKEI